MKEFTRWIAQKIIKNNKNIADPDVREKCGALEGWVSIAVNSLLFAIKIVIGLSLRSIALVADAIHTLSDSATSIIVIIGFKLSKKPSDKEHPFGHGRMESIAALIISVLLFVAGIELLEKSVYNIFHPQASVASLGAIFLIIATIAIKEILARFSFELGKIIGSNALKADALHHRSDAITTSMVIVSLIATRFGFNQLDGVMGIFVSLVIFYCAYLVAKEAINPLLGEAPSKETLKNIEEIAKNHNGVLGIHDIIYHKYGQTSVVSMHIEVSDKETASRLHEISESVEEEITQKMGGMVVVHIDPINKEHPHYELIYTAIKEIISQNGHINSFHELRIVGQDLRKCTIIFDLSLKGSVSEQEIHDIIYFVENQLKSKFPDIKTAIKAEPTYVHNL